MTLHTTLGLRTRQTFSWVPADAVHYIEHTVLGRSIRAIARDNNCHASTILRRVRRLENRRDCPLVDAALKALTPQLSHTTHTVKGDMMTTHIRMSQNDNFDIGPTQARMDREALHALRRLCETGAVMAVAWDMETAVIVREDSDGGSLRTANVEREIAQALALNEWIASKTPDARVARYRITTAGRAAFRELMAQQENRAQGLAPGVEDGFQGAGDAFGDPDSATGSRYLSAESPIVGLARRKDRDGQPFLSRDMVNAGERLRQDFELSQVVIAAPDGWEEAAKAGYAELPQAAQSARDRVSAALAELGPGLMDVAMRCCCLLQGLEATEKVMGWSARSGKIVLRIAMIRLIRHYEKTEGKFAPLIG